MNNESRKGGQRQKIKLKITGASILSIDDCEEGSRPLGKVTNTNYQSTKGGTGKAGSGKNSFS